MARKKKPKSSVTTNPKLEAVAKATYARKRNTTEIIPPDVTRAKAGAWLDLISPLTEWAGLKGDNLRIKRELLRVHREDVLAEIAQRCKQRLEPQNQPTKPLPVKFVVPFLEQASLEDIDSSLVDLWANLLVSASEDFNQHHTHFISVINRLSGKQGEIIKGVVRVEDARVLERALDHIHIYFESQSIQRYLRQVTAELISEHGDQCTDDVFAELLYDTMNEPGLSIVHIAAENTQTNEYFEVNIDYSNYSDADEVDFSILEAIDLMRRVDTDFIKVSNWEVAIIYYHLTSLGFHFAKACRIVI